MSSDITIIVPTSSIPSHPSTEIINRTLTSITKQLPDSPIIITCDGLRPDHAHRAEDYRKYQDRLAMTWPQATIIPYPEHVHQTGMLPVALAMTLTPLVFYLEHDWEVLEPIEWEQLREVILAGEVNYIKLHAGNRIHPLHEHLMEERVNYTPWIPGTPDGPGIHLIRTRQWSQNPHLALTKFYRKLQMEHLEGAKNYIENELHGIVGQAEWEDFRCTIYNPIEGDMKRVQHLDGRQGDAP